MFIFGIYGDFLNFRGFLGRPFEVKNQCFSRFVFYHEQKKLFGVFLAGAGVRSGPPLNLQFLKDLKE